ncbi:MAG: hypothetical protein P1U32_09020 [Legionellaceae bacterium]|nr:hypothetical protein [Legionellaceae bacterium]
MTIIISGEEKRAIQDYFDYPERYMSESDLERLGGQLPNGAKISRKKESEETPGVIVPRCYIITDPQDATTTYRIPMQNIDVNDPGIHSATRLSGEIYFHQNKDDLPKKLPENFEDYCEPPENEEEAKEEWYVQYKAGFIKLLEAPDYVLSRSKLGVFDRRIKYAVNTHGERCYLKSDSLIERAGTAFSDVCVAQDSGLYVGPSIFRCAPINDVLVLMKKIVITRDAGETLDVFMEKPQKN